MLISTTLNTLNTNERAGGYSALEAMDVLFDAGYRGMDIPFFKYAGEGMKYGETPFFSDDWEAWAHRLREHADGKGIVFNQTHNLTYNFHRDDEDTKLLDSCVNRAIIVGEIVGAANTVIHPIAPDGSEYDHEKCLRLNTEYFKQKADFAAEHGSVLLLENMLTTRRFDNSVIKRYCDNMADLTELIESVDMPNVKICFDVGHAHYMSGNECEDLRAVKQYIQAVHIHDNDRWNDEHLAPFSGTINWESFCRTMAEIDYPGDFTYEIAYCVSRMPGELQPMALRSSYQIAEYLVSQIEEHRKRREL